MLELFRAVEPFSLVYNTTRLCDDETMTIFGRCFSSFQKIMWGAAPHYNVFFLQQGAHVFLPRVKNALVWRGPKAIYQPSLFRTRNIIIRFQQMQNPHTQHTSRKTQFEDNTSLPE